MTASKSRLDMLWTTIPAPVPLSSPINLSARCHLRLPAASGDQGGLLTPLHPDCTTISWLELGIS